MSMHDIEDLVHGSVLVLDAHHPEDDDRLRDWFTVLYAFQRRFDCSHTQGRVLDILLRRRHTYRFPVDAHPDHAPDVDLLARLTGFTELGAGDEDGYGGLDDGYVDPPWLYCEAGTALWRRMVDAGRLRGPDAVPPRRARLIDVVVAAAAAAERAGDVELIGLWHGLGPDELVGAAAITVDDLREEPAVGRLREIVRRTGAASVALPEGYRPSDDDLDGWGDDRESWWYDLGTAESVRGPAFG